MKTLFLLGAFMFAPTALAQAQTWEYAKLVDTYIYGVSYLSASWYVKSSVVFQAKDHTEIYEFFKKENPKLKDIKLLVGSLDEMSSLEAIGLQRWEMIDFSTSLQPGNVVNRVWYFKRPVK